MRHSKLYPDFAGSLQITDSLLATVKSDELGPVTVQLADENEAAKMIAEYEDPDGELMYEPDSVFAKYGELHIFRP